MYLIKWPADGYTRTFGWTCLLKLVVWLSSFCISVVSNQFDLWPLMPKIPFSSAQLDLFCRWLWSRSLWCGETPSGLGAVWWPKRLRTSAACSHHILHTWVYRVAVMNVTESAVNGLQDEAPGVVAFSLCCEWKQPWSATYCSASTDNPFEVSAVQHH